MASGSQDEEMPAWQGDPEPSTSQDDASVQASLLAETKADCSMRPVVFNYSKAFTEAPLVRYLINGVIVTLSIFLIQIVLREKYEYEATDESGIRAG